MGGRFEKLLRIPLFLLRIAALLGILFLLAAGTAALVVKFMMPPEVLKTVIAGQLQEALQRPVQVGDVAVVFTQGLRVRGLRILQAEGFPGEDFITSDTLLAKYRWSSILGGRLEFTEVRLVSPRIRLVRREDGAWSVADLFKSRGPRPAETPLIPMDLAADVLAIDDGEMTVQDLREGWSHTARKFNLEVRDFDTQHAFPVSISFANETAVMGRQLETYLEFKGQLDLAGFDWSMASLKADPLRLKADGKSADARVALRDFIRPTVVLDLKVPALATEDLKRYVSTSTALPDGIAVPASFWKASLATPASGHFVLESLEASGGGLKASAKGALTLHASSAPWTLTATAPSIPLAKVGALWAGWSALQLQGASSATVTLSGDLRSDKPPVLDKAQASARGLKGRFLKDAVELQGVDGDMDGRNGLETMTAWAKGDFAVYGSPFRNVNALLEVRKGDLVLNHADFTWGLSKVKLKGGVKNLQAPSAVNLEGAVDKLNLDHLIRFIAHWTDRPREESEIRRRGWSRVFKYAIPRHVPNLSGRIRVAELTQSNFQTFNLDARWDLTGISTGLKAAGGKFRVAFGPGRAADIQAIQQAHKLLNIIFLPFVYMHKMNNMTVISAATAYPKTLDFNRIYGEYSLGKGVVNVRPFHVDSGQLQAYAEGFVDFPKELVDLHILTRLTQSRGPLPEYLTDEEGRPSIGFFVENNLNKPDLRLEYTKMDKDAIERSLEQALKENPGFATP